MLPSYLHNNVFSAPNWTFVHGFCVLVPNYVANHVVFWSNFCRESRCFGDTFRPLKMLIVTQKGFFAGLSPIQNTLQLRNLFNCEHSLSALQFRTLVAVAVRIGRVLSE